MLFPQARILIFAKAPEPGYVKTRLIPAVGEKGAADLYEQLLKHIIESVTLVDLAPLQLWCAPDCNHALFQQLACQYNLSLFQQSGIDLGERMYSAADSALKESDMVLLMGADCPQLTSKHLSQSLRWLMENNDAVVGPAEDGGYVLLGLGQNDRRLFEHMPWGGDQVLKLTRQRLRLLGWRWQELEPLWDIDRPEDIKRWQLHKDS